jgi:hypothetical protein
MGDIAASANVPGVLWSKGVLVDRTSILYCRLAKKSNFPDRRGEGNAHRATPRHNPDNPHLLQRLDGLPDDGPADAQLFGHLAFREKPIARLSSASCNGRYIHPVVTPVWSGRDQIDFSITGQSTFDAGVVTMHSGVLTPGSNVYLPLAVRES